MKLHSSTWMLAGVTALTWLSGGAWWAQAVTTAALAVCIAIDIRASRRRAAR